MPRSVYRASLLLASVFVLFAPAGLGCAAGAQSSDDFLSMRPIAGPIHSGPVTVRPHVASNTATTTTLTLSATSVNAGTAVTLTAHVAAGATSVTPGILSFCNAAASTCTGSALLASAVLTSAGSASRTLLLPVGAYSILASFQGTTPYAASSSAPQTLTVEGDSTYVTKATLTSVTGSKGSYAAGASLTSHAPTAPTGSLVFTDTTNNRQLGSISLANVPLGGYQPFGLISTGSSSGPNDLVMGDFNNDGIPDFAVPDASTGEVAIFLGKGDGTFAAAVDYSTGGTSSQPLALAVGDFNGDGNLDLAVALGSKAAVLILLGKGDGTFSTGSTFSTAGSKLYFPVGLTVGDFNHDGKLDIVTANNSYDVSVLLGNGDGTFQTFKQYGTSKGPTWITSADFNNDGNLDLAVTTSANNVDILLGNGDGTFQTYASTAIGTETTPESVVAADLDGDGNVDLVVACYGANALGVLLGNGDGTFLPVELYSGGDGPIAVTIADLNGDGIPDVVVTDLAGNGLTLFQGVGDGTFLPLPGYSTTTNSEPAATVVADLNADGTPEIVTGLYKSNALYIMQNDRIQGALLKGVTLSTSGTIDVTASYAGDSNYAANTSTAYAFTGSATTAVAPVFSPVAGSFTSAQSVTISSATTGAFIYYTLDGTTPTAKSTEYVTAIPVKTTTTISAIAIASGFTNSSVSKGTFLIETPAAAPTFSPAAGSYTSAQTVTLASTTPSATIYYTLNGTTPTTSSAKYTAPITVSATTTIEALATATNYTNSTVSLALYSINLPKLALASSVAAPKANQSLQLTATLTSPGTSNLAGSWTISDGKTVLCTGSQTTQSSYVCAAKLAHGVHSLTAAYTGKSNGLALTAALSLTVN
jgi:hypothetical protein